MILPTDKCADEIISQINNSFNLLASPEIDSDVYLSEILHPTDPITKSPEMNDAKNTEIRGLLKRGTFTFILKKDVPPDGNILSGRFVFSIYSLVHGEIKFKARYVIGGHRDKLKDFIIHSTNMTQPQSIRILLSIAPPLDVYVWGDDVKLAYLQSMKKLNIGIFIYDTVHEFELDPEQCLLLFKPPYGLCDSGDLSYIEIHEHLRLEAGMKQARLEPALYVLKVDTKHKCSLPAYVDDLLCAGKSEMREVSRKTRQTFEMDYEMSTPIEFTGVIIKGNSNDGF